MKFLNEISALYWLESEARFAEGIQVAEAITGACREHRDAATERREAAVLARQFQFQFLPTQPGDAFAGRVVYPLVGLSPEPMALGYYCVADRLAEGAERYPAYAGRARALIDDWRDQTTVKKTRDAYPAWVAERLPSDQWVQESGVGFPLYRMGGSTLDYAKLLRLGLDGLERYLAETPFGHVPGLMRETIDRYVSGVEDPLIRDTLRAIRHRPPQTFREAIQLFWLYALHAGTWNYGRLDVILGPFLHRDREAGVLSEEEALELTCSLWRLMHDYRNQYNNRVYIGGRGRPDEAAADRFALLAIAATRRVRLNQPQLSLRFHAGQNPELWERALDAIGEGCTFPILYNDDANIPAVARAFQVDETMAAHYTPYGCGEYGLGHFSVGSPNGVINLLKALEVALHGGVDPATGRKLLDGIPGPGRITTFAALWDAYAMVVEHYVEALATQEKVEYDVAGAEAPCGFISALLSDCAERGVNAFAGGVRFLGGTLETYGNTNTADSLHAINELVFQRGRCELVELVEALDANFAGRDALRRECLAVSKYGNDEGLADAMARRVHEHVCAATAARAQGAGLHHYLVVIINNWANTILGRATRASADGRLEGQPMANANNPSPGADTAGVTAFLNSLLKLDASIHAGSVQNMKFSKEWFGAMRPKLDALLQAYFARGGTQAMITVVSRDDLEAAMRAPEQWGHLMVRVGGFSIRFVELPPEAQREVLERTLY